MGVVIISPKPIITAPLVMVCCSSMKKICGIALKHCLHGGQTIPMIKRNTAYDAMVMPCYRSFHMNA